MRDCRSWVAVVMLVGGCVQGQAAEEVDGVQIADVDGGIDAGTGGDTDAMTSDLDSVSEDGGSDTAVEVDSSPEDALSDPGGADAGPTDAPTDPGPDTPAHLDASDAAPADAAADTSTDASAQCSQDLDCGVPLPCTAVKCVAGQCQQYPSAGANKACVPAAFPQACALTLPTLSPDQLDADAQGQLKVEGTALRGCGNATCSPSNVKLGGATDAAVLVPFPPGGPPPNCPQNDYCTPQHEGRAYLVTGYGVPLPGSFTASFDQPAPTSKLGLEVEVWCMHPSPAGLAGHYGVAVGLSTSSGGGCGAVSLNVDGSSGTLQAGAVTLEPPASSFVTWNLLGVNAITVTDISVAPSSGTISFSVSMFLGGLATKGPTDATVTGTTTCAIVPLVNALVCDPVTWTQPFDSNISDAFTNSVLSNPVTLTLVRQQAMTDFAFQDTCTVVEDLGL